MAKSFLPVALVLLLLTGCAGIRPAVQPPPQPPQPEPEPVLLPVEAPADTTAEDTDVLDDSELGEETPPPEDVVEEPPLPSDDNLDLPPSALPPQPAGLTPVGFLPSEGPAPKGEEPPAIGEGWRVQVASVTEQVTAREIEQDVRAKTDASLHTRWQGDRYTLLVGNFTAEADAIVLRDKLRTQGYEGAFVVRAPVVTSKPASVKEVQAPSEPQIVDGYRVQVMSLTTRADAERAARQVVSRSGMPAYVEEVNGSFKVRAGDFRTRDEAVKARALLVEAGYEGSFPVETKIILQ